jgi:hypothetical protein
VCGVTVWDIAANKATATSTPTDETAQLRIKLPTSHQVGGLASIGTSDAQVALNVQPGTDKGYTAAVTAFAKRKRGAVRPRIHTQAARDDRYQVYKAESRAGANPDMDIRMTLREAICVDVTAGYRCLQIVCPDCRTIGEVDLAALDCHPEASLLSLVPSQKCMTRPDSRRVQRLVGRSRVPGRERAARTVLGFRAG